MGVGVLQTIPALALLSFMIPLFGIGRVPALVALSLYALLPIVRNTYAGLVSLDPQLVDMAAVIGLDGWKRLGWVELPLASVTIPAALMALAVHALFEALDRLAVPRGLRRRAAGPSGAPGTVLP